MSGGIWLLWSGVAVLAAGLFTRLWPRRRAAGLNPAGPRFLILRWGHAVVWLLLALSFALRGLGWAAGAEPLSALAGLAYLVFMGGILAPVRAAR